MRHHDNVLGGRCQLVRRTGIDPVLGPHHSARYRSQERQHVRNHTIRFDQQVCRPGGRIDDQYRKNNPDCYHQQWCRLVNIGKCFIYGAFRQYQRCIRRVQSGSLSNSSLMRDIKTDWRMQWTANFSQMSSRRIYDPTRVTLYSAVWWSLLAVRDKMAPSSDLINISHWRQSVIHKVSPAANSPSRNHSIEPAK